VPSEEIINEIKSLDDDVTIDYYTFSGRGEPTLAENLGEVVDGLKKINKGPLAILTNSSLIARYDVREALRKIDFVSLKLDAYSQESFEKIDRPAEGIEFSSIVKGMREFANSYRGRLALQMMFVDENKNHAKELADIAKSINPDEVQLNTPLRPSGIKPISEQELDKIERQFKGLDMDIISVYHAEHKKVKSISAKDTLKRRGKTE
jgi:wyosine [tRNA(Phe)-imidazoG37] synthetase (radical SAM superfamily)